MKKTAVLICPGRGTYNAPELGYIARHHGGQLAEFDAYRAGLGQETVSALDGAARFSAKLHTRGDNASPLIYAASLFDAQALSDDFDIVAVTGNSMGWYIALAAGRAVTQMAGFEIVNTMGTLMQERLIGGQVLYPFVDENWQEIAGKRDELLALVGDINSRKGHQLAVSIHLGGMLVVAGDEAGLSAFEAAVPTFDRYPMRLPNHAAFHTSLQMPVAAEGQLRLGADQFGTPDIPLIDGRGAIWWPGATDATALRDYTLGVQVTETYDFTKAIQVAAREFAPDVFIVTGPGATLGGAIAQSLIGIDWDGVGDKAAFQLRQSSDPILIAMGRDDQRPATTKHS
ncbi:MAG: ACP S-malonyltransferase [Marinosulfonomonas sp.]|nr:ACP S-malonyltransferase [Marinosulfonomonas sp.]